MSWFELFIESCTKAGSESIFGKGFLMSSSPFFRRVSHFAQLQNVEEVLAIGWDRQHLLMDWIALLASNQPKLLRAVVLLQLAELSLRHRTRASMVLFVFVHRLLVPQPTNSRSLNYLFRLSRLKRYISSRDM